MAGKREQIIEASKNTRFQPGNPGGGRRKDILNRMAGEYQIEFNVQLSEGEKFRLLESMMEMSLSQLERVAKDRECPAFMVNIATAMVGDIGKKQTVTVDKYFDRFFGKAINKMQVTGADGKDFALPAIQITIPAAVKSDAPEN